MTSPAPVSPIRLPSFALLCIALLAGMGIFVVVVGIGTVIAYVATKSADPRSPTTSLLVALLFVNAVASTLAGLATGKMTRNHSLYTVLLLALMLATSSSVPLVQSAARMGEPDWYLVTRCVVVLVGIIAGGVWQRRETTPAVAT